MDQAIPVRTDYTAGEVRRFAQRAKDAAQARRLLAIAAVLDGASREEAAKIGGMDRQTPRDWVIQRGGTSTTKKLEATELHAFWDDLLGGPSKADLRASERAVF
jgi:hypothetical protein